MSNNVRIVGFTITVVVNTKETEIEIKKALKKGIYYGLDIKHIASPDDVSILLSKIYEND